MSWRRGLRHCLPSGFPGSYRLFTILEDRAWYTPLVLPGKVAVAGLVLDEVYNGRTGRCTTLEKSLGEVQGALKGFAYEEYQFGGEHERIAFKVTSDDASIIRTSCRSHYLMGTLYQASYNDDYIVQKIAC